jgi:hypothetical protein
MQVEKSKGGLFWSEFDDEEGWSVVEEVQSSMEG